MSSSHRIEIKNKIYDESIIYLKNELSLLLEASSNGTNFLSWIWIKMNNKIVNQIVPKKTSKCSYSKRVCPVISIMILSVVI